MRTIEAAAANDARGLAQLIRVTALFLGCALTHSSAGAPPQAVHIPGLAAVMADPKGDSEDPGITCVVLPSSSLQKSTVARAAPEVGTGDPNIIYLDFDGEVTLDVSGTAFAALVPAEDNGIVTVPSFADSLDVLVAKFGPPAPQTVEDIRDIIITQVRSEYAPYHVVVTDDLNVADPDGDGLGYERLYVGGSRDIFANAGTVIVTATLGIAELDRSSVNPNSIGFVFVEHFAEFLSGWSLAGPLMGVVAAHEAGHTLGLEHVENVKARMFFRTSLDAAEVVETWRPGSIQDSNSTRYQDSALLLGQTLGLSDEPFPSDPTPDDYGDNFFDASAIDDPTTNPTVVVDGEITLLGDVDVVQFTPGRSTNVTISVEPTAQLDAVLAIIDQEGSVLEVQDTGTKGSMETAALTVLRDRTYRLYINAGTGLSLGSYQLRITDDVPFDCPYDLDGNDGIGPGDFAIFAACWKAIVSQRLQCGPVDFDGSGAIGSGDFACFAPNWLRSCDQVSLCGLFSSPAVPEGGHDVELRLVARPQPSEGEQTNTLPESVTYLGHDAPLTLEIWGRTVGEADPGLACVFLDLEADPDFITLEGQELGTNFSLLPNGTVDPITGELKDFGACVALEDGATIGQAGRWMLVGRVTARTTSDRSGVAMVALGPASTDSLGISQFGLGDVDPSAIFFDRLDLRVAQLGDADADGDIDLSDFLFLQACFSGPGQFAEANCGAVDHDRDGDVDLADIVFLQATFTGSN